MKQATRKSPHKKKKGMQDRTHLEKMRRNIQYNLKHYLSGNHLITTVIVPRTNNKYKRSQTIVKSLSMNSLPGLY